MTDTDRRQPGSPPQRPGRYRRRMEDRLQGVDRQPIRFGLRRTGPHQCHSRRRPVSRYPLRRTHGPPIMAEGRRALPRGTPSPARFPVVAPPRRPPIRSGVGAGSVISQPLAGPSPKLHAAVVRARNGPQAGPVRTARIRPRRPHDQPRMPAPTPCQVMILSEPFAWCLRSRAGRAGADPRMFACTVHDRSPSEAMASTERTGDGPAWVDGKPGADLLRHGGGIHRRNFRTDRAGYQGRRVRGGESTGRSGP